MKQGDALATLLFNIALIKDMGKVDLNIPIGTLLNRMHDSGPGYADNIDLIPRNLIMVGERH